MHRRERFSQYAADVARRLNTSELRKRQIRREISLELSKQYKISMVDDPRLILGWEEDVAKSWQEKIDIGLVPLSDEFISSIQVGNLPLVHITRKPNGVAKGIIAIGPVAIGVVAIGGLSIGVIGLGGLAFSLLLSLGGLSLSAFSAFGGLAISGYLSTGGLAVSYQTAIGGLAVAKDYAIGGSAFGEIAVGGSAKGVVAVYDESGSGEVLLHISKGYAEIRRQILRVAPDFPEWLFSIVRLVLIRW